MAETYSHVSLGLLESESLCLKVSLLLFSLELHLSGLELQEYLSDVLLLGVQFLLGDLNLLLQLIIYQRQMKILIIMDRYELELLRKIIYLDGSAFLELLQFHLSLSERQSAECT